MSDERYFLVAANMTAVKLFYAAKNRYPEGVTGDNFLPVTVEGQELELRIVTGRGRGLDVEFRLFPPGAEYARKTIIVYANGRIQDDSEGIIPKFDQRTVEPTFTLSDEDLVKVLLESL